MGAAHAREGSGCSTWRKNTSKGALRWKPSTMTEMDGSKCEVPRLFLWRNTQGQFTCLLSGLAWGKMPQVLAVPILPRDKLASRHPASSKRVVLTSPDAVSHILHHSKSLSPPSPKPCARLPQLCQNLQGGLQAVRSPHLPVCPVATALGTVTPAARQNGGTMGQGDNKGKRSTNPQGDWGPRGCPEHLPASGSLPAPHAGVSSPALPDAPA